MLTGVLHPRSYLTECAAGVFPSKDCNTAVHPAISSPQKTLPTEAPYFWSLPGIAPDASVKIAG